MNPIGETKKIGLCLTGIAKRFQKHAAPATRLLFPPEQVPRRVSVNAPPLRHGPAIVTVPAMRVAPAFAQSTSPGTTGASPWAQTFKAADARMMKAMNVPLSGDADQDFVAGMIPHHQGAVDRARFEVQYGKNPEMRQPAQDIIKARNKEIARMRDWQARHPQH